MGSVVFQGNVQDDAGNVISGAAISVVNSDSLLDVDLFSDKNLTSPIDNPFFADANGAFEFYCDLQEVNITASSGGFSRTWNRQFLNSVNVKSDIIDSSNIYSSTNVYSATQYFNVPSVNNSGIEVAGDLILSVDGNNSGRTLEVDGTKLLNIGDISTINVGNSTTKVTAESGVEARIVRARTENNSWSGQQDFGTITASTSSLGVADSGTMEVGSVGTTPIGGTLTVHGSIGLNGPVEFRDMTGGGSTVSLININGNLQANGSAVATKTSPSATVWDDGNLNISDIKSFDFTFDTSYGVTITAGVSASYPARYCITQNTVYIEFLFNFNDAVTPVSVNDRITMSGLPSELIPVFISSNAFSCGEATMQVSFAGGNRALYDVSVADSVGSIFLQCTSVIGSVNYGDFLGGRITYRIL